MNMMTTLNLRAMVSNENGEPIHVHVSKGRPTPNATKIWLTRTGGCIVASNGSQIASKD